jgi:hypothetical protein
MSTEKKLYMLQSHIERKQPVMVSLAAPNESSSNRFFRDTRVIDTSFDRFDIAPEHVRVRHEKLAVGRREKLTDEWDSNCSKVQTTPWPKNSEERQMWDLKRKSSGCPQAKQDTGTRLFADPTPPFKPLRAEHLVEKDRGARDYHLIDGSPLRSVGAEIMTR